MKRRGPIVVPDVQITSDLNQRPGQLGLARRCCNDQGSGFPGVLFIRVRTGLNMLPNGFNIPLQGCHVEADTRRWGLLSANRQRYKECEC